MCGRRDDRTDSPCGAHRFRLRLLWDRDQVARRAKDRLGADGVNLLDCSGEAAWQTVFHFHIHVIPRFEDEPGKDRLGLPWATVPSNPDEIRRIGNLLS